MFVKIMNYDLKLAKGYSDTLEERVARLLTNDLGETLRTEVSFTLINEFKKFMYLVATDILDDKREGNLDTKFYEEDKKTGQKYYAAQLHPPYILDLVWRFIIQEGKIYEEFCNVLCGGFIDRLNPRINLKGTMTRYLEARSLLEKNENLLRPYWGLWPLINSVDKFETDYDYDMLLHTKEKENELADLRRTLHVQEVDQYEIYNTKILLYEWREKHQHNFGDLELAELDEDADISPFCDRKNIDHIEVYERLMAFEFDHKFTLSVCIMFSLTDESGKRLIIEYKNFLYMYYLTEFKCAPSFEIDSFWDLHYASTKDYREFCDEIFGEYIPSKNYDYDTKGIKQRTRDYKKSLEIYEILFNEEPNEILWESAVDLTINSKNGFQHLNLFKYVNMQIHLNLNDSFSYKNTLRRSKDTYYDKFDDDEIETINQRNKLKIMAANGNPQFERLKTHLVVDDKESIDDSEERDEAERLVEGADESITGTEIADLSENEDGAGFKIQRMQTVVASQGGKSPSKDKKTGQPNIMKNGGNRVIFDPVLTKGGFKILPKYHDTYIFEEEDLVDIIEDGIYNDYIHKGSNTFKDIFDVAILSKGDIDLAMMTGVDRQRKLDLGVDPILLNLTEEDLNFKFDTKEKFNINESKGSNLKNSQPPPSETKQKAQTKNESSSEDPDQSEYDSDEDSDDDSS